MDEEHELDRVMNNDVNDIVTKSIITSFLNREEEGESTPNLEKQIGSSSKNTDSGVVIQFGDKFWGIVYEDGRSKSEGWVVLKKAIIYNPEFLKRPVDATYENSPYISELEKGTLVRVSKTTIIDFDLKY